MWDCDHEWTVIHRERRVLGCMRCGEKTVEGASLDRYLRQKNKEDEVANKSIYINDEMVHVVVWSGPADAVPSFGLFEVFTTKEAADEQADRLKRIVDRKIEVMSVRMK